MIGDFTTNPLEEREYQSSNDDEYADEVCTRCRDFFVKRTGKVIDSLPYCEFCAPAAQRELT